MASPALWASTITSWKIDGVASFLGFHHLWAFPLKNTRLLLLLLPLPCMLLAMLFLLLTRFEHSLPGPVQSLFLVFAALPRHGMTKVSRLHSRFPLPMQPRLASRQ